MKTHIRIIGFAFLLSGIFSLFKYLGDIDWSWWFCTAPVLLAVGIYSLLTILGLIVIFFDKKFKKDIKDL